MDESVEVCRRFKRRHTETAPVSAHAGYSSGGMGYSSGGLVSGFNPGDGAAVACVSLCVSAQVE